MSQKQTLQGKKPMLILSDNSPWLGLTSADLGAEALSAFVSDFFSKMCV